MGDTGKDESVPGASAELNTPLDIKLSATGVCDLSLCLWLQGTLEKSRGWPVGSSWTSMASATIILALSLHF